jgi:uncharacterized membrane protein (DUF2068 family)
LWMAKRGERLVVLIGAFKLVKAALLIAVGVGGIVAMPDQLARAAQGLVAWMGIYPGRAAIQQTVSELWSLDHSTAQHWGELALCYAAVFVVEGMGLIRKKRWAEWLTVFVTASFIPFEIYELVVYFSAGRLLTLAVNVAVVIYLAWRRVEERRGTAERFRRMIGMA